MATLLEALFTNDPAISHVFASEELSSGIEGKNLFVHHALRAICIDCEVSEPEEQIHTMAKNMWDGLRAEHRKLWAWREKTAILCRDQEDFLLTDESTRLSRDNVMKAKQALQTYKRNLSGDYDPDPEHTPGSAIRSDVDTQEQPYYSSYSSSGLVVNGNGIEDGPELDADPGAEQEFEAVRLSSAAGPLPLSDRLPSTSESSDPEDNSPSSTPSVADKNEAEGSATSLSSSSSEFAINNQTLLKKKDFVKPRLSSPEVEESRTLHTARRLSELKATAFEFVPHEAEDLSLLETTDWLKPTAPAFFPNASTPSFTPDTFRLDDVSDSGPTAESVLALFDDDSAVPTRAVTPMPRVWPRYADFALAILARSQELDRQHLDRQRRLFRDVSIDHERRAPEGRHKNAGSSSKNADVREESAEIVEPGGIAHEVKAEETSNPTEDRVANGEASYRSSFTSKLDWAEESQEQADRDAAEKATAEDPWQATSVQPATSATVATPGVNPWDAKKKYKPLREKNKRRESKKKAALQSLASEESSVLASSGSATTLPDKEDEHATKPENDGSANTAEDISMHEPSAGVHEALSKEPPASLKVTETKQSSENLSQAPSAEQAQIVADPWDVKKKFKPLREKREKRQKRDPPAAELPNTTEKDETHAQVPETKSSSKNDETDGTQHQPLQEKPGPFIAAPPLPLANAPKQVAASKPAPSVPNAWGSSKGQTTHKAQHDQTTKSQHKAPLKQQNVPPKSTALPPNNRDTNDKENSAPVKSVSDDTSARPTTSSFNVSGKTNSKAPPTGPANPWKVKHASQFLREAETPPANVTIQTSNPSSKQTTRKSSPVSVSAPLNPWQRGNTSKPTSRPGSAGQQKDAADMSWQAPRPKRVADPPNAGLPPLQEDEGKTFFLAHALKIVCEDLEQDRMDDYAQTIAVALWDELPRTSKRAWGEDTRMLRGKSKLDLSYMYNTERYTTRAKAYREQIIKALADRNDGELKFLQKEYDLMIAREKRRERFNAKAVTAKQAAARMIAQQNGSVVGGQSTPATATGYTTPNVQDTNAFPPMAANAVVSETGSRPMSAWSSQGGRGRGNSGQKYRPSGSR